MSLARPLRRLCACALPALLLALAAARCAAAADAPADLVGKPIRKIEFRVSGGIDEAHVKQLLGIQVGDLYRPDDVQRAIRRLYALDIVPTRNLLQVEPADGGVGLVITVQGAPLIVKVDWVGRLELAESDLREGLEVHEGVAATRRRLHSDLFVLREKYRAKGFRHAAIEQEVVNKPDGPHLLYLIDAGPRVRVEEVDFVGNRAFSAAELRRLLATAPGGLFKQGEYDPDAFRVDLQQIVGFYRYKGWRDVEVGHTLEYDVTFEHLFPRVRIREHERYTVDAVKITGAGEGVSEKEIRDGLRLKVGGYYSVEAADADRAAILDRYGVLGRAWAKVEYNFLPAGSGNHGAVYFTIEPGPVVYVEEVLIEGNLITDDHVIRRDVSLIPGRRVDTGEIARSRRRLLNTGLFGAEQPGDLAGAVDIHLEHGSAEDQAVVIVKVHEANKGTLEFGATYTTSLGLGGLIEITHRNFDLLDFPKSWSDLFSGEAFAGGGQTLKLHLAPGFEYQNYTLSWRNPAVYDSPYSLGFDAFLWDSKGDDYTEQHFGMRLPIGREVLPDLRVTLTPSWERIAVRDVDSNAADIIREAEGWYIRNALSLGATYDKRDNRFLPTQGYVIDGEVTLAGTVFGGNVDVVKERLEAGWYATVWDAPGWGKHVLHIGGEVSAVQPTRGNVPFFERYFAGGQGSVRGFEYRGIGPVDTRTGDHIGGEARAIATVEYEVPLYGNVLRGVAFVDAGKVAKAPADLNFTGWSAAAGFGLRLRILGGPTGVPLAFDFGFPILRQRDDSARVFSFSIGTGFEF